MKQKAPYQDGSHEPTKRLSVNLPESLHTRFKTACNATNRRMAREILGFVARRTEERERETGPREGRWAKPAPPRPPRLSATAKRQLRALDRALECNHPTGDIDEMLANIERGRPIFGGRRTTTDEWQPGARTRSKDSQKPVAPME